MMLRTLILSLLAIASLAASAASPASAQATPQVFAGTGESERRESPYPAGAPRGAADSIPLGNPFGVEIRGTDVWLTTIDDHCIWRTTLSGRPLVRVAGNGTKGYAGDGGLATKATFNWPHEVRVDQIGNLFIADTRNHVIRRVDAESGIVTTLAGNGTAGFAGDGATGNEVQFSQPHSVVLDGAGGLLVADTANHRIRRIELATGVVTTISGTGKRRIPSEGQAAGSVSLFGPRSLAVDETSIWIALREGNSIWRIDRKTDTIHRVAGTGKKGYSGDGGPPLDATFNGPKGLVLDDQQRILVVDTENQAVRRIDLENNLVETVLGGKHSSTTLKRPHGISFHPACGLMLGDSENHRVLTSGERD